MKKVIFGENEFVVGHDYELLRVWRKLKKTCWTYYQQEPRVNTSKVYALRVIPAGKGQTQDWPELEWFSASQLIAMLADL